MIAVLGFVLAAGLAALGRGVVIAAMNRPGWPWGTLTVNVTGSLAAGIAVAHLPESLSTVLGIAALGAFTTFSTFAVEVTSMWSDRRGGAALGYVATTAVLAVGAAAIGLGF